MSGADRNTRIASSAAAKSSACLSMVALLLYLLKMGPLVREPVQQVQSFLGGQAHVAICGSLLDVDTATVKGKVIIKMHAHCTRLVKGHPGIQDFFSTLNQGVIGFIGPCLDLGMLEITVVAQRTAETEQRTGQLDHAGIGFVLEIQVHGRNAVPVAASELKELLPLIGEIDRQAFTDLEHSATSILVVNKFDH